MPELVKPKALLLIGRRNWEEDNGLNTILLSYLKTLNVIILWEDPGGPFFHKMLGFENRIKWLPEKIKLFTTRVLQFALCIFKPGYYTYLKTRLTNSVDGRIASLEKRLEVLHDQYDLYILSRSSGGVVASKLADKWLLKQLICISYPFENPANGVEPYRFEHLENLRTPFVIFQGINDEYGGTEVVEKYKMSNNIKVCFVNADHNFNLDTENWQYVLAKIKAIILADQSAETNFTASQIAPLNR